MNTWPILDSEEIGALFWAHFSKKGHFACSHSPKRDMPFLTISNKNIFFKTQGNRLGAIVAPSKIGPGISTYEYKNNSKYTYKHTHN